MLREPKRFSSRHWWNYATIMLVAAGLALWIAGALDGRMVFGAIVIWVLLGWLIAPTLMHEHLGFLDRWLFHDYSKAHQRYRKAVNTERATPQAYCALASLAYAEGDLAEAAQLLEESSNRLPRDAHLHFLLSRVLSKQGRHEEAIAEAVRAREIEGGVLGDVALGDALSAKPDMLSAASAYQRAVSERPDLVHARVGLTRSYLSLGRFEAAEHEIAEALKLAPRNADVLYWAGKAAAALNHLHDARKFLQAALDSRPIDDQARLVPYNELVATLCEAREDLPGRAQPKATPSDRHFDRM